MSRLDDLIATHCQNGVKFVSIDEVFDLRNGYTPSRSDETNWTDGTIPWFRMEDIRENGRILSSSIERVTDEAVKGGKFFPANSLIVATSATIGEHALITVPFLANQRFTVLSLKSAYQARFDIKFLFYFGFKLDEWCLKNTTTSSFASVDMSGFRRFRIPVPPIEVQREIVRILDHFTELEAELEAELVARRLQYGFVRRDLLSSSNDCSAEQIALGDIAEFRRGVAITQKEAVPGDVPVVANAPMPTYFHNKANRQGKTLVIARSGAYAGLVSLWDQPIFLTDAFSIHPNKGVVSPDYLFHFLQNEQTTMHSMKKGSGVPHVRVKEFERLTMQVPSLDMQERIVDVLNKFDALVNDISIGLPAELAARRKQYEYYRDKLLTFDELLS